MRVAAKLAAVLMLATVCALALQAITYTRSVQQRAFDKSLELAGPEAHAIAYAIRGAWLTGGPDAAEELAATYSERFPGVDVRVRPSTPPAGSLSALDWPTVGARPREVRHDNGDHAIETSVAIGEIGATEVRVVVERGLPDFGDVANDMTRRSGGIIALLLAGASLLTLVLGYRFIGVPVQRLTELADRVSEGDFSLHPRPETNDELGQLARALTNMKLALAHAGEEVAAERRARTRALEQLRHADRLTTMGKLTSVIAHELGTPLNVVMGRAGMILLDPEDAEEARESAEVIEDQARHMTTILRDILDFSRKRTVEPVPIDADTVARHAVRLLEPMAEDDEVTLRVSPGPTVSLLGREAQVTQVLTNLIVNAIDACEDGCEIIVRWRCISTERAHDTVSMAGEFVCFEVEDNGRGMSKEVLDSVFDAFFTTKGSGTGLGLSVIRQIVDEHRGWIDVTSQEGEGTTFSVHFPMAPPPELASAASPDTARA